MDIDDVDDEDDIDIDIDINIDDDIDDDDTEDPLEFLTLFLLPLLTSREDPVIQHDSILTGNEYYLEILRSPNVHRFHDVARMDRYTFFVPRRYIERAWRPERLC